MGCCVLLRDGHRGGGRWLTVGDGGGGFVAGLLLAVLVGVGCWENGGVRGRWRCWSVRNCGGRLLSRWVRRGDVGVH